MLSVITGKQRAGKTFYCVEKVIIHYLKETDRHIYTNLPIFPSKIAKYCSKSFLEIEDYMERIHLFVDFSKHSLKHFKDVDYQFYSFALANRKEVLLDGKKVKTCDYLIRKERAKDLWNIIKANSVIVLDECYEIFNNMDYTDNSKKDTRRQLLSFCRQHGHYKLDIYLISHNLSDLDKFIRNGTQYLYVIRNSKYSNMIDYFTESDKSFATKFFRGLKWPVQFFIIQGYEFGEKRPSDRWVLWPNKKIFGMYDSFSNSTELKMSKSEKGQKSGDTHVDHKKNIFNFLGQAQGIIIFCIASFIGIYVGWQGIKKLISVDSNTFKSKKQTVETIKPVVVTAEPVKTVVEPVVKHDAVVSQKPKEVPKVVLRTNDLIRYADGFTIRKNDMFKDFVVMDIQKNYVVLLGKDLKSTKVSLEGMRR